MLLSSWRKRKSHSLLVWMQIDAAALKISMENSQKFLFRVLINCRIWRPNSDFQVCGAKALSCWVSHQSLACRSPVAVLLALKAGVIYHFVCVRGWKSGESLLTGEVAAVVGITTHCFSNIESPVSRETSSLISSSLWLST